MKTLIDRQKVLAIVNPNITPTGDADYDNTREWEREDIYQEIEALPLVDAMPVENVQGVWNKIERGGSAKEKSAILVGYITGYKQGYRDKRHGIWVGEADGYADGELVYDMWSCSNCGTYFEQWEEKPTWKYCPNCGANMEDNYDTMDSSE